MKFLIVLAASVASAMLVLPTVSQAQAISGQDVRPADGAAEMPCHRP